MNKINLLLVIFICLNWISGISQESKMQVKNKTLPSAIVYDLSGQKVDISSYGENNQPTIFTFWATWCVPCKKELSNMADMYDDWKESFDVEIVAISVDDARNSAKVKSYANAQDWEFDVLLDKNAGLKRALNFHAVPYLVLVDKDGTIIYTHTGYIAGDEYVLEEIMEEKL